MNILTRGDLDGLTSSVLLTVVEKIRDIRFAHPKDVQDGKIPVTADDIVVNLPFVPGCAMWFDHHVSQSQQAQTVGSFKGKFSVAPSCARVIYDHYKHPTFNDFREMLVETDRLDSAQLRPEDVLNPQGWILLGYTLDPRTGFGPEFQKYFRWLVEYVKELPLDKVLMHPEVRKRCDRVRRERDEFVTVLLKHSRVEGKVIVTDFRGLKDPPIGNRFLIYTLYPEANVEVRIHEGKNGWTVNAAIGKSIFNRTSKVNVGLLCQWYGGGGHAGAGTCQLKPEKADEHLGEIMKRLNQ